MARKRRLESGCPASPEIDPFIRDGLHRVFARDEASSGPAPARPRLARGRAAAEQAGALG